MLRVVWGSTATWDPCNSSFQPYCAWSRFGSNFADIVHLAELALHSPPLLLLKNQYIIW